jgi:hypothetical protein
MTELYQAAVAPVNLPLTMLLGLVLAYWMLVILGAVGLDMFDIDLDSDVHDVGDVGGSHHVGEGSAALAFLRFLNIGDVPVMVVVSFFVLSMWVIGVAAYHYLGSAASTLVSIAWIVPNVIVSLLVAKLLTTPLKLLFRHMNAGVAEDAPIVGKTCVIKTSEATSTFGQAEVLTDGAPVLLNVRTKDGIVLSRGDEALIIDFDQDTKTYLVVRFDLEA